MLYKQNALCLKHSLDFPLRVPSEMNFYSVWYNSIQYGCHRYDSDLIYVKQNVSNWSCYLQVIYKMSVKADYKKNNVNIKCEFIQHILVANV